MQPVKFDFIADGYHYYGKLYYDGYYHDYSRNFINKINRTNNELFSKLTALYNSTFKG